MPVSISSVDQLQAGTQDDLEREKALLQQQAAQKYATADADLLALLGQIEADKAKDPGAMPTLDVRDPNWRQKYADALAAQGNYEVASDYAANGQYNPHAGGLSSDVGDYGAYQKAEQAKQAADAYQKKIQSETGVREEIGKKLGAGSLEALLMGDAQAGKEYEQTDASRSLGVGLDQAGERYGKMIKEQDAENDRQAAGVLAYRQNQQAAEKTKGQQKGYLDYIRNFASGGKSTGVTDEGRRAMERQIYGRELSDSERVKREEGGVRDQDYFSKKAGGTGVPPWMDFNSWSSGNWM